MELRLPQHPTNTPTNSSFIYYAKPGKGLYNNFFSTNDRGSKIRPTMVENIVDAIVNNDQQKRKEKWIFYFLFAGDVSYMDYSVYPFEEGYSYLINAYPNVKSILLFLLYSLMLKRI